jgi:alpha-beta hydrolase superfamily lysophospholipase
MKKPAMHPPILGYVTPLSAQPGQTLSFRISSAGGQPFTARVLRIHCADPNPDGPGMQLEPVDFPLQASYAGREMAVYPGACALAALDPAAQGDAKHVELRLLTKPTRVQGGPQVLARAGQWSVPSLLLWAGDDRLVAPAGSQSFADRAPPAVVQSQRFDGAYHELFNESDAFAAPVFARLQDWLGRFRPA